MATDPNRPKKALRATGDPTFQAQGDAMGADGTARPARNTSASQRREWVENASVEGASQAVCCEAENRVGGTVYSGLKPIDFSTAPTRS